MFCSNCGATLEDGAQHCPNCGSILEDVTSATPDISAPSPDAPEPEPISEPVPQPIPEPIPEPAPAPVATPVPPRKKPHIALRILLQFVSFVLCICLSAGLLAGVALLDVHTLTSSGGINRIITALFTAKSAPSVRPVSGAIGTRFDEPVSGDFTIPSEIFDQAEDLGDSGTNFLIDFLYDTIASQTSEPLPVSKSQLQSFVEKSTVSDYLSEKIASYADDFLNGTENTVITTKEVLELLDENKDLIESEFGVEITPEIEQSLTLTVEKVIVDQDLNGTIRQNMDTIGEKILESVSPIPGESPIEWAELQALLQFISSDVLLWGVLLACLALILLLCLANFYNVPAGLTWSAVPAIVIGLIVSLPLAILQCLPQALQSMLPHDFAQLIPIAAGVAGAWAPVHYGLLGLGLVMLIGSIVWRCIRTSLGRKKSLAA